MPRNTLMLITVLVLITIGLFGLAVYSLKNPPSAPKPQSPIGIATPIITPTVAPMPRITFSQSALTIGPGQQGKLGVILDTQGFSVAQVQLDLAYDISVISNVVVKPGLISKAPLLMGSKPSSISGQMRVVLSVDSQIKSLQGVQQIATITFTTLTAGKTGVLAILPSTVITVTNDKQLDKTVSASIVISKQPTASPSAVVH